MVQFVTVKEQELFEPYRSTSESEVFEVGGERTHWVHIDQFLVGGEMPYQAITVDQFSTTEAAQRAFDATSIERQAALVDIYAPIVRPNGGLQRISKTLGFLRPLLSRLLGTNAEKGISGFTDVGNPETGPVPETVAEMRQHDQTTPFYMMNLNKYYARAKYDNGEDVSGEQAYNRYGKWIAPYLVSVGGYPDIMGQVLAIFVGDETSPLHDNWSEFAMVYYPSRKNFINMMTHSPQKGIHHRTAGLQRAVLMSSSDLWARKR